MNAELQRLTAALESRLPEHTFKAVMRRADDLNPESRVALLADVLGERERSEAAGLAEAVA